MSQNQPAQPLLECPVWMRSGLPSRPQSFAYTWAYQAQNVSFRANEMEGYLHHAHSTYGPRLAC